MEVDFRRIGSAVTALALTVLLLLGAAGSAKPVPDDPEPVTLPPLEANPYGPGDFTLDAQGYLTCTAGEGILGIDVSSYQGWIDWQQVKEAGIRFVMIRLGSRGYGTGEIYPDDRAREYYQGARAAGLQVGAYFFSQAISVPEAVEEANFVLQTVRDWELEMPLVFDWEFVGSDARTGDMDARTLTDCTRAFCRVIRRAGYTPMVYFNLSQSWNLLYMEELTDFQWWLARYGSTMDFDYRVDMWQYTSAGTVPGITGNVDLNLWFPE